MAGPEPYLGRVLRHLLVRRIAEPARYAGAVASVLVCFLLRLSLPFSGLPYLVFIPALLASSLLLGRGPGLVSTLLSAALALFFFISPVGTFVASASGIVSLALFVSIGIGIAVVCHTLRTAMVGLIRAEREKTLLFDELSHRTKNNLQMISSLLHIQGRTLDPASRDAFVDAAARVNVIAKLQDRLNADGDGGAVDIRDYLADLCGDLADTLRAIRPLVITVEAEPMTLATSMAAPIGLIVNELVTNCLKYAFPDGQAGTVVVAFRSDPKGYALEVRDDGIGSASNAKDGLGSRLISQLVAQLQGRITRSDAKPGTATTIVLPASAQAMPPSLKANRGVAPAPVAQDHPAGAIRTGAQPQ